jgi:glycosidase
MTLSLVALIVTSLGAESFTHTFRFETDRTDIKSVTVAGAFNAWNNTALPMAQGANKRIWTASTSLKPGVYQYKFVLNGTEWVTDPKAKDVADGNGNTNSQFILTPPGYQVAAQLGDGKITESVVHHGKGPDYANHDRGDVTIRIRLRPQDVQTATLELVDMQGRITRVPTRTILQDEIFEIREATFRWDGKAKRTYRFALVDGQATRFVTPAGLQDSGTQGFDLGAVLKNSPQVPGWVEDTIFYQIFPDRFENGSKANDPAEVEPWNAEPKYFNRFGGDAIGVGQRMNHLTDLGVNGVYFNPIMEAPANHRYDPADFYLVDNEFGTNKEFGDLTRQLNKAGIKVVLDQIFDHVGVTFPPFVDLLKNQQNSKYKDYFFVNSWPVSVKNPPPYQAWYGFESMPKVNLANPELKKYLLGSLDFWHKNAHLDGWRLDVANEVPDAFWREFRPYLKRIKPDAWIVGEVWSDARQWLQGDMWDASMNYPFRYACVDYIAKGTISPTQFLNRLMEAYRWYAPQVARNQMNLLSSHDTARFLHDAGNDESLQKLAATVQMTWVGSPSIYYGEELGMQGGPDPQNRRGMEWNRANAENSMLAHYKRLIQIRKSLPVLRKGTPVPLRSSDSQEVAVFGRKWNSEMAIVLVNRSSVAQTVSVPIGPLTREKLTWRDVLAKQDVTSQAGELQVKLAPRSAIIAVPQSQVPKQFVSYSNTFSEINQ